jgi:hypothetical protein
LEGSIPSPLRAVAAPALAFLRRHALFAGLLACGAGLRVVTLLAYRPALLIYDSQGFLANAEHLRPDEVRPLGYGFLLRIVGATGDLAVVPPVQHLMGLVMGVLLYALVVRLGVPRWVGALAAAPVLLDAYQLNLEQHVMSETLFELLVVGGCAALLWRRPPHLADAAVAGALFAGAALTRANGIVVIVPALLVLALASRQAGRGLRPGLAAAGALAAAFLVPVGAYAAWFHSHHGSYAVTSYGGRFLYARVTPFADCSRFRVPAEERRLCPTAPVGRRPTLAGSTVEHYMWGEDSPIWQVPPESRARVGGRLARRVIRHQPFDYLKAVGRDFTRGFAVARTSRSGEVWISRWQFQLDYPVYLEDTAALIRRHGGRRARVDRDLARFLRGYQRFGFTPGPVLALGLVAGLLAAAGAGRAPQSGLRWASFLFAATGLVVFASTVLVNQFSWRYQLPLVALLPPAAVLGLAALTGAGRRTGPGDAP